MRPFKTIDLNHRVCCSRLYARLVWQVLFDEYRQTNGPLEKMDDMLCNLYIIERYFDDWREQKTKDIDFVWSHTKEMTELQPCDIPCEEKEFVKVQFDPNAYVVHFFRMP